MTTAKRLDWVDMAKGISILFVVMMYSVYSVGEDTGMVGFMHYAIGYVDPFRMPEFFLISGLFLSQVIGRPWARYADRRVAFYLYFYALWAVIHIAVKVGLAGADPMAALGQMAFAIVEPYGVLWFIYVLAVFALVTKLVMQAKLPVWLVLAVGAGLQMSQFHSPSYLVTQFAAYFVFFYVGYVAAPLVFKLIAWVENHPRLALLGLALWAVVNGALVFSPGYRLEPTHMIMGLGALPGVHLSLAVAGALAICTAASLLSRLPGTEWLRWLGEHSLIIYVAFAIPMSAVRILALKTGILTEPGLLSVVVLLVATVSPIILLFATRVTGFGKFLFERPDWAHLPGGVRPVAAARPSATPAE